MQLTQSARIALAAWVLVFSGLTKASESPNLEEAVCGSFKEWLLFNLWSAVAGKPDPKAAASFGNVVEISHRTSDGRLLRGFKIRSKTPGKGSLLFAQGNAMLADQVLASLSAFARDGIDVYVFDYRGYGLSEGAARLKAIANDYTELAHAVAKMTPGKRYLYGVSFGGIVLLNALSAAGKVDAIVIDSSPSIVSDMGCPATYDPVTHVPESASHVLMIVGDRDQVVPPSRSARLAEAIRSKGGIVERRESFAHPFMDSEPETQRTRSELIRSFLASK